MYASQSSASSKTCSPGLNCVSSGNPGFCSTGNSSTSYSACLASASSIGAYVSAATSSSLSTNVTYLPTACCSPKLRASESPPLGLWKHLMQACLAAYSSAIRPLSSVDPSSTSSSSQSLMRCASTLSTHRRSESATLYIGIIMLRVIDHVFFYRVLRKGYLIPVFSLTIFLSVCQRNESFCQSE